jgi:ribosomal protein L20A (L18A)
MNNVKTVKVKGELKTGLRSQIFTRYVRSLSIEEAQERVINEIGSRNKLKRNQIKILSVEEIDPREVQDPTLQVLAGIGDKINE